MDQSPDALEPGIGDSNAPNDELFQVGGGAQQFEVLIGRGPIVEIDSDNVARFIARYLSDKLLDPRDERFLIGFSPVGP